MKTWLLKCSKGLRILVIVFLLTFVISGTKTPEVKVMNGNLNKTLNLSAMAMKIQEDIKNDLYAPKDTFVGDLTGYGADCALCTGQLACMHTYDVLNNGVVSYDDATYGEVRIVASSSNLACGTIITFDNERIDDEPTVAIVLDRGVLGTAIDLLTPSEDYAGQYVGRQEITYDVLRFGWGEK